MEVTKYNVKVIIDGDEGILYFDNLFPLDAELLTRSFMDNYQIIAIEITESTKKETLPYKEN